MDIKPVTYFETPDGERFATKDEAHEHVAEQADRKRAEEFAERYHSADGEEGPSQRTLTRTANTICAWESWKRDQAEPPAEEAAE